MNLKNKKVLLVGLGILGGGLATAKYLLKKGAKLTITDLRSRQELQPIINKLPNNIRYFLGNNPEEELKKADIIILNPAVSAFSPIVKKLKELKKEYYNDYKFFLKNLEETNPNAKIIGITGTRGKTTTSTWTQQLIDGSVLGGNIPEASFAKILNKKTDVFILELSSFQLEHLTKKDRSPNIAIITNIYIDHLNRYRTLERYKKIKKMIYANQQKDDYLIISNDESIRAEIENDKPKSKIIYVSLKELPKSKNGLFSKNQKIYFKNSNSIRKVGELPNFAKHEKVNFMFAALAANLYGIDWDTIFERAKSLKTPQMRQQVIYEKRGLKIVNDSASTSPDAVIAAIEKFKNENLYLITGGTNKELEYSELAQKIANNIRPERLFLLSGSGTDILIDLLPAEYIASGTIRQYDQLSDIVKVIAGETKKGTIVFSPGGASFEKFKNEFDRGKKFDNYVKKYFK